VGPSDADNGAVRPIGRRPEGIALALDDEGRDIDVIELSEAAPVGAARRVEWKCEAYDGDRVGLSRGATRNPRAQRSTAGQDREAAERSFA
jgi:hypothetical protein